MDFKLFIKGHTDVETFSFQAINFSFWAIMVINIPHTFEQLNFIVMIAVKDLLFTYKGQTLPTLKNISFRIDDQEIFGFLGPSGAGKSTTQKVLTGVLKNYRGSVMLMGREVNNISRKFYENIGVAFEFPNGILRSTTGRDCRNLRQGLRCQRRVCGCERGHC